MKKIAVVTGARSEYGLLRWVIDEIHHATELQLQLIVTGGHLSPEQGLTYRCIEEDGYDIDAKVDMLLSSDCASGIAKSMGMCSFCFWMFVSIETLCTRLKAIIKHIVYDPP